MKSISIIGGMISEKRDELNRIEEGLKERRVRIIFYKELIA